MDRSRSDQSTVRAHSSGRMICSRHAFRRSVHSFLHDALPISDGVHVSACVDIVSPDLLGRHRHRGADLRALHSLQPVADRKSTRLNSSHLGISYAVFCLKKKTSPRTALTLPHARAPTALARL